MKNLKSMQLIIKYVVEALHNAVDYNLRLVCKDELSKSALTEIFGTEQVLPGAPLELFLKELKEELGNDYNREFFEKIYMNAFCANRRSPSSIHLHLKRIIKTDASECSVYIDVDKIAEQLSIQYKFSELAQLINSAPIYTASRYINTFDDVTFESLVQPDYGLSTTVFNPSVVNNYFLLQFGAQLSATLGVVALIIAVLAITAVITVPPFGIAALVGGAAVLGVSSYLFFKKSKSYQPILENLPEDERSSEIEVVDIQQLFIKNFGTHEVIEVEREDDTSYKVSPPAH